jgi:hypothetical protein
MRIFLSIISVFAFMSSVFGQGVKGYIYDHTNEALPFATIYVRNIESGTTTNIEGYYEVRLAPGKYDMVFQYMGYESLIKVVEIGAGMTTLDVVLKPQTIVLQNVVIKAGKEDPAYTIMRKTIAKAKYHKNQLDAYSAQVYIKGSGRLIDSPFFLRKTMAKEGIDSTSAFAEESVIEVKYTRPNQYEERAISIRTSGESNNTSPTSYINGSFYDPKIVDAISPLSPRAFAYYRFIYKGTFTDRGYAVSKIRVIPRSKGDDVFEGDLLIIEDQWSIHSLNLKTTKFGIGLNVSQIYDPIENKVWMPVSHKFDIEGTFLGFEFEYDYLATVSNYEITLNPDLDTEFEVIDDKVDQELAKKIEKDNKKIKQSGLVEQLQSGKELTRKDLRKLMREYEKVEMEEGPNVDVIGIRKTIVDSTAYNNDSTYWAKIRPVPLSKYEVKGYHKLDSMTEEGSKAAKGDTTKVGRKKGFQVADIVLGNTYKVGNRAHLKIKDAITQIGFNTVEGFNFSYGLQYTKTFENKHWLSLEPTIRYAVARETLIGDVKARWKWSKNTSWTFAGGRNISQYNDANPIHPAINALSTLFYQRNYMKIYERDYLTAKLEQKVSDKLRFSINTTWAERHQLYNNTDYTIRDVEDRSYTPNVPVNDQLMDTEFTTNQAVTADLIIQYVPKVRYRIINDKKRVVKGESPIILLNYKNGLAVGGSDVKFSLLDVGIKQGLKIGAKGKLSYKVNGGVFFNNDKMTFVDYRHFMGNRIFFQTTDPVGRYRLLDYYQSSTSSNYLASFVHYDFRKFLLTRLPFIQKKGLKEALFVNYLATNTSGSYTEVGYSINNIYRLFRVEAVTSFQDGRYLDWGIRVGISTNLGGLINFN